MKNTTVHKKKVNTFYDPYSLGLSVSGYLKSNPNKVLVHCIHHIDNSASAVFNVQQGQLFCFSCHKKTYAKEIAMLTGGFINRSSDYFRTFIQHEPEYSIQDIIANITNNELALGNSYLARRGLTETTVREFEILEDNESVYFPVSDQSFNKIGYVGRRYRSGSRARYIYLFDHERPQLFNFNLLPSFNRKKTLYVVENFFAVPRGYQFGLQVLSTFGSVVKTKNLSMWLRDFDDVVLLFDKDKAGFDGYLKAKQAISHAKMAYPVKSADDLEVGEWDKLQTTNSFLDIKEYIFE